MLYQKWYVTLFFGGARETQKTTFFFLNHDMLNYCSQFTAKDLVFCCTSTEFWHREDNVKHGFSFLFFCNVFITNCIIMWIHRSELPNTEHGRVACTRVGAAAREASGHRKHARFNASLQTENGRGHMMRGELQSLGSAKIFMQTIVSLSALPCCLIPRHLHLYFSPKHPLPAWKHEPTCSFLFLLTCCFSFQPGRKQLWGFHNFTLRSAQTLRLQTLQSVI